MPGMMVKEKRDSSIRDDNTKSKAKIDKRTIKSKRTKIITLEEKFTMKRNNMILRKANHDDLKEKLARESEVINENFAILHEEIEQWKETVNSSRTEGSRTYIIQTIQVRR